MQLKVENMTEKYAIEVLCWKYEKPYDYYNNVLTSGAILELVSYRYYVVLDGDRKIIGYFCIGKPARVPNENFNKAYIEDCVDIGIGMKPELTGKGFGTIFFQKVLEFVEEMYEKDIRLTVATFNKRAIRLYEKFHFKKKSHFEKDKEEFMTMIKKRSMRR